MFLLRVRTLEVLKVLQKSYYNKVKCIIIDPPYNTGSDSFIYPDSFKENKADYEKRIGDKDEAGYLMKEGMFRKNSKDSGHFPQQLAEHDVSPFVLG
jgi:adenine-specific DNA-methyltransferase